MKTILIILAIAAVVAAGVYVATKYFGLFTDADKDGIPDEVEEKVAEVKVATKKAATKVKKTAQTVKTRAKRVKEELGDVKDALKDVVEQTKDVASAAKVGARKGRKPRK